MAQFQKLVEESLAKARHLHRGMNSAHEAYAVILEELDEVKAEVWAKKLDRQKFLKELVHVAAMCQRSAEDLGLVASSADSGLAEALTAPAETITEALK